MQPGQSSLGPGSLLMKWAMLKEGLWFIVGSLLRPMLAVK